MRFELLTLLFIAFSCFEPNLANAMRKGAPPPEIGSCEYYQFLEGLTNCGPQGYPLAYGLSNCEKISKTEGLSSDGILWLGKARTCLQRRLEDARAGANPPLSCTTLHETAFASHTSCYLDPEGVSDGPSICDLPLSDIRKIFKRIKKSDIFSSSGIQTTLKIAENCAFHHRLKQQRPGVAVLDSKEVKQRIEFFEKLPHD